MKTGGFGPVLGLGELRDELDGLRNEAEEKSKTSPDRAESCSALKNNH